MGPGKGTDLYVDVQGNLKLILEGTMLSVDPSVGSSSSQPGWALYMGGNLVSSGVLEIEVGTPLHYRLQTLAREMRKLYKLYDPDVLAFEDIPSQRYGGGNAEAHASLLKAVGVILSIPGPRGYIRLKPMVWKRLVRDTYVKGDQEDAEEMGRITVQVAQEIQVSDPPRRYRNYKSIQK